MVLCPMYILALIVTLYPLAGPNAVPEILLTFDPEMPRVDVFLGSYYKEVVYRDHAHTLYPGWLGSLPYRPGLTYQELPFSTAFPVSLVY